MRNNKRQLIVLSMVNENIDVGPASILLVFLYPPKTAPILIRDI